ncbi:hypothetical protein FHS07_002811 [Microbacterium proteolyticum]|uniref:Uncharacterized protein n=1 Tax=Microbacterium proteolyticum TaxID=1572644 RepID=A0A7W5CK11_9MICO|nr:hypothetical protein [Microbacterium proteolyticum]MBB3159093.1 hypothetical protein [Microbacterium proteolyticum]
MRRQGRSTRVARGAAAASVATFVALLSHVTGGGEIPGVFGIAVPLALSFVVCTVLAGRRLSLVRLSIAVALSQVLFHTLFVLGSYSAGAAAHVHGAPIALAADAAVPVVSADAAMWAGHLVAAMLTTALLHRGERTVTATRELAARCIAWVRARARVVAAILAPAPVRRVGAPVTAEVRPVSVLFSRSTRRRGPPLPAS